MKPVDLALFAVLRAFSAGCACAAAVFDHASNELARLTTGQSCQHALDPEDEAMWASDDDETVAGSG